MQILDYVNLQASKIGPFDIEGIRELLSSINGNLICPNDFAPRRKKHTQMWWFAPLSYCSTGSASQSFAIALCCTLTSDRRDSLDFVGILKEILLTENQDWFLFSDFNTSFEKIPWHKNRRSQYNWHVPQNYMNKSVKVFQDNLK